MILRGIVQTFVALVEWLFGLIPDGPEFPDVDTWELLLPVPAGVVEIFNGDGAAITVLLALLTFRIGYGVVQRVAKLVLGARGDAL